MQAKLFCRTLKSVTIKRYSSCRRVAYSLLRLRFIMRRPEQSATNPILRLDNANGCLWRGSKRVALTPKDFEVLRYLVTHSGQLVRKEELLDAIWPDITVSAGVIKVSIRRIRRVLQDNVTTPRFIETAHRRGYWFIGTIQNPGSAPLRPTPARSKGVAPIMSPINGDPHPIPIMPSHTVRMPPQRKTTGQPAGRRAPSC